jgi:hypothetical protein
MQRVDYKGHNRMTIYDWDRELGKVPELLLDLKITLKNNGHKLVYISMFGKGYRCKNCNIRFHLNMSNKYKYLLNLSCNEIIIKNIIE